ncbi:hypothetical protein HDC34_003188 [Pseudoclavibacter sp. JAI123]|uniref:hypothetical protein n=1 Tax=unclassified Pseudoclavibacter TaxID=2615177 RepID=UPI0015C732BA|nr:MULTISPECIES: hypothetical protein [unclassified Pseudoclavibacter]MBF4457933.1 hypothetical protein [Pseudoclavibacter sp. VKM Ac-2867]NYF14853.1 hypothetical protein [Pseudoclavibacter sp. JAI123]
MTPRLFTPGRFAIVSVPALGFFAIPFLPFAVEPTLWFGLPAVLVWSALMVLLSVAALQIVEVLYKRAGGAEADAQEADRFATQQIEQIRATRIAAEEAEGVR